MTKKLASINKNNIIMRKSDAVIAVRVICGFQSPCPHQFEVIAYLSDVGAAENAAAAA